MSLLKKTRGIGHCRACDSLLAVWSRPWNRNLRACAHNTPQSTMNLCRGSNKPANGPYTLRADF